MSMALSILKTTLAEMFPEVISGTISNDSPELPSTHKHAGLSS